MSIEATRLLDAAKQALEMLETDVRMSGGWSTSGEQKAIAYLRQVISEAEGRNIAEAEKQEPVAWLHWLQGPVRLFLNKDEAMMELDRLNREYPVDKESRQMRPLYTHPQPIINSYPEKDNSKREPLTDEQTQRIVECAKRLVEHADFKLGGILSADSKSKEIPSKAVSSVKARHLASLRDALAAHGIKGEA